MPNKIKYIIVGCGFKTSQFSLSEIENVFEDKNVKINIGAAISLELVKSGLDVILISKSIDKLRKIKESLNSYCTLNEIEIRAFNILDENLVKEFSNSLNNTHNYFLIHSAGLSSGQYDIKNENPYLPIEQTSLNLIKCEFESVVNSLFLFVKHLLPIFRKQEETRIVVVSSMSSIRAFPNGFSHTSAKGALHQAVKSMRHELNQEKIFVSEVLPGIVDTGYYDNEQTQIAVKEIAKYFGYEYDSIPMMQPSSVAEAVKLCLLSNSHILELSMVSQGQFPYLGS